MQQSFLKRILDPNILLEKVLAIWIDSQHREFGLSPVESKIDLSVLEHMSEDKQKLFVVFNYTTFKLEYVGANVESISGYSQEEVMKRQFSLIFQLLSFEHIMFFVRAAAWMKTCTQKISPEKMQEQIVIRICGLTFKNKSGQKFKTFIRVFPYQTAPSGYVQVAICEIEDMTSLLKSDDYWMHTTAGKSNTKSLAFFSNKESNTGGDLLSTREMDVLKLAAANKSTKEIAEALFLSPLTVEKHRKNMLNRIGARDMTALVELCKRCGLT